MTDERPPWRRKRGGDEPSLAITRLNQPKPIEVRTSPRGIPREITRDGRRRLVAEVQDIWRVDDEWWRTPISRRYYLLVLDDGDLWSIFEDLESGEWFSQHY